jgi:hypothetical protein
MQTDTLTAPVGRDVKNAPEDVDLARRMLRANGFMVAEFGPVDGGFLKALEAAQKKAGIRTPDGVLDPLGRTAQSLRQKFLKAEAEREDEEARLRALKLVEVTLEGERLVVLQKEHEKLVDVTLDRLERHATLLIRCNTVAQETYRHYLDVAMLERGLANAVVQAVIVRAFSVEMPDGRKASEAIRASGALERAILKRSLQAYMDVLPAAEQAISDFEFEVQRFLREFGGAAHFTGTATAVTSAACFAVVGALATAALTAPAVGMTMAKATAMSGAGVGALSSLSKELGAHAAGMDVSVAGSVGRVVLDGIIGAVGGWVTEKIPLGFVDTLAKSAAMRFGAFFPGVGAPQVKLFFVTYLQGAGADTIKTAVTEAIGILGKSIKEQRVPTQKDFEDAVQAVLLAALSGGVMKNLGSFGKNFEADAELYVGREVVPDLLKRLVGPGVLSDRQTRKLTVDTVNAVSGEVVKAGWGVVLEGAKGDEAPAELSKLAIAAFSRDRVLQAQIEAELVKALKKAKIPLK